MCSIPFCLDILGLNEKIAVASRQRGTKDIVHGTRQEPKEMDFLLSNNGPELTWLAARFLWHTMSVKRWYEYEMETEKEEKFKIHCKENLCVRDGSSCPK